MRRSSLSKKCIELFSFSHGGHLFAAIDANTIQIISPIHIKVIHRLNHGQSVMRSDGLMIERELSSFLGQTNSMEEK